MDDALRDVAIADALRRSCADIEARLLRAFGELNRLKSMARDLGYSDAEIDAYVASRDEKARMRDKAKAYVLTYGVQVDDVSAFCQFGRDQISAQTRIGRLLR